MFVTCVLAFNLLGWPPWLNCRVAEDVAVRLYLGGRGLVIAQHKLSLKHRVS